MAETTSLASTNRFPVTGRGQTAACRRVEATWYAPRLRLNRHHGFATAALEAGADVRTVADLMGHSTTRTTQDTYQHPSNERKRAVVEQVAAVIQAGGTQRRVIRHRIASAWGRPK